MLWFSELAKLMQVEMHNMLICTLYIPSLCNFMSQICPATPSGILLPKLFWPTVRKNCTSDQEKLLKFEAEGQEFANFWDH